MKHLSDLKKKKKKEGLKGELTWPLSFNISLQV